MIRVCKVCRQSKPLEAFRVCTKKSGNPYRLGKCLDCERGLARVRAQARRNADPGYAMRAKRRYVEKDKEAFLLRKRAESEARRRRQGMRPLAEIVAEAEARRVAMRADLHMDRSHQAALRHIAKRTVPKYGWTEAEVARWLHKNNPQYAINQRMRVSIRKALRGAKAGRSWEQLVGYTVEQLIAHLEKQVPRGYTMSDLIGGRLHIDHITPKSAFDVTDPEQLRACWCLSNLRPLPSRENIAKGRRRTHLL